MTRSTEAPTEYFEKDDGRRVPVSDERFLFPYMMPTSKNTQLRDGPPPGDLQDHQRGRILLQVHQLLYLLQAFGIDLRGKRLLDVGTGNGMIPRLALEYSELDSAVGCDPYLDGETVVSWQVHDQDKAFTELREFIDRHADGRFDFDNYRQLARLENYSLIPAPVRFAERRTKQYRFAQVGAHDLHRLEEKFDVFYCKAIEHISDWDGVFRSMAAAGTADAVIYFKHRTFFSYLGAHRRGSIGIPWGHLLLTDEEYRRFVRQQYPQDAEKMIEFYFRGLTYPRASVPDMVRTAQRHGFIPVAVVSEPTRYGHETARFIGEIDSFWKMVHNNHPTAGADEVLAGMYHILFRKISA